MTVVSVIPKRELLPDWKLLPDVTIVAALTLASVAFYVHEWVLHMSAAELES